MRARKYLGEKKDKIRAYCRRCRHEQVFMHSRMHHGVHLLFSVLTLGLWAVSWLSIYLGHLYRPWRCEHCGWHKPEFPDDPTMKSGREDDPAETSGQSGV